MREHRTVSEYRTQQIEKVLDKSLETVYENVNSNRRQATTHLR